LNTRTSLSQHILHTYTFPFLVQHKTDGMVHQKQRGHKKIRPLASLNCDKLEGQGSGSMVTTLKHQSRSAFPLSFLVSSGHFQIEMPKCQMVHPEIDAQYAETDGKCAPTDAECAAIDTECAAAAQLPANSTEINSKPTSPPSRLPVLSAALVPTKSRVRIS
jgi:hypothetical protein